MTQGVDVVDPLGSNILCLESLSGSVYTCAELPFPHVEGKHCCALVRGYKFKGYLD